MKACRVNEWGEPVEIEEVARPSPAADEVLVRVRAASINPMEVFVAAGYVKAMLQVPLTIGTDFAGEVAEVGADITHVKPGDNVYGFVPMRGGTFAEYVVAKGSEVAPMPKSLSFEQAAAVPLTALAAWQGLYKTANLKSGERVLIHGVAGGIGAFAAQFAKQTGAYVIGTGDAQDEAFAQKLGVDEFINYKETRFKESARDMDVVFATIGGDVIPRSFEVMKPGGRLVTTGRMEGAEEAQRRGLQAGSFAAVPSVDDLAQISRLIDAGKVKVYITDTLPLAQAQQALELSQQRDAGRRKVVLSI
jgi:NADPH:quinone reductase-like Zn-dependent oxidoreductase